MGHLHGAADERPPFLVRPLGILAGVADGVAEPPLPRQPRGPRRMHAEQDQALARFVLRHPPQQRGDGAHADDEGDDDRGGDDGAHRLGALAEAQLAHLRARACACTGVCG